MVHALLGLPHVVDAVSLGEKEPGVFELTVESEPDADLRRDVFALLARKGWPLLAMKNMDLTLEDLFLQLTSGDAALAHSSGETSSDEAEEAEQGGNEE